MAYTYNTIGTFTAGNVLTAAEMNDIGENSNNYRVPPLFVASFAQSANDTTNTSLTLTEIQDTDSMFASGTTVTVNTAGLYMITCYGTWSGGAAPTRADVSVAHSVDGQLDRDIRYMSAVEGNRIALLYVMSASQTLQFNVFQDNAANTARTFTGQASVAFIGQVS